MNNQNDLVHQTDFTGQPLTRIPDHVRASGTGVIFNEKNEVLLQLRSDNSWWGLPGGGMDPGESLSECTVREVFEETGLCVEVGCLVKVYSDISDYTVVQYPDGNLVQYVAAVYICYRASGILTISKESLDIGYFHPSQFPEKTVLSTKLRCNDALRHISEHNCSSTGKINNGL